MVERMPVCDLQKEAAKAQENAQEIAGKEVQEAKEKEEAAVKELEAAKQREAEIKRQLESAVKEAEEARKDVQEAKEKQAAATKELEASKLAAYKEKACTNAESSSLKAQLEAARKKEAEAKAQLDRLRKEADAAAAMAGEFRSPCHFHRATLLQILPSLHMSHCVVLCMRGPHPMLNLRASTAMYFMSYVTILCCVCS